MHAKKKVTEEEIDDSNAMFEGFAKIAEDSSVLEDEGPKDLGEAYGMIAGKLADPQNMKILTELTEEEIRRFSAVLAVSKYVDIPELDTLIKELMTLKISKNRLGRKEMLELASNMGSSDTKMQESKMRRLLSLGGRI